MNGGLPTPVILCLAGFTILGGVVMWMLYRWVFRRGAWSRFRALHREQSATAAVETPYALLVVIIVTLCTWQLGQLAAAYQVVDLAAFKAARAAAVIIPRDATWSGTTQGGGTTDMGEKPNKLDHTDSGDLPRSIVRVDLATVAVLQGRKRNSDEADFKANMLGQLRSSKGDEIYEAAAWACVPISGRFQIGAAINAFLADQLSNVVKALAGELLKALGDVTQKKSPAGAGTLTKLVGLGVGKVVALVTTKIKKAVGPVPGDAGTIDTKNPVLVWPVRYLYARQNTRVEVLPGNPTGRSYAGGTVITCRVTHRYDLRVPYAAFIFGSLSPAGVKSGKHSWQIELVSEARMVTEGFPETRPPGAPLPSKPKFLP